MGDIPITLDAKDLPGLVDQLMTIFRDIYEDNLGGTPLSGLTALKLLKAGSDGNIASADLDDFVAGTAYQITVTDDGGGTITLSTPQQLHTSANVQFGTVNKLTLTVPATAATFTLANGKTFTVSNTVTLTASDGATLAIGTGGTLGTAAYTAATAYEASGNVAVHAALTTGIHGAGAGTVLVSGNIGSTVQAYSANAALRTDKLSAFAATTSAELAGVVSDETGTGSLVFGTAPTITASLTHLLGTTGGMIIQAGEATADITAAHTITIQSNVPAGSRLLEVNCEWTLPWLPARRGMLST